jgi:hypothetical protein
MEKVVFSKVYESQKNIIKQQGIGIIKSGGFNVN